MILSHFQWYRRMRGGYWAQVTAPLGILSRKRWVRCKESRPTPDQKWTFYPWAQKEMGNGYIDEWHEVLPFYAVAFSGHVADMLGTNESAAMQCFRKTIFYLWNAVPMTRGQIQARLVAEFGETTVLAMVHAAGIKCDSITLGTPEGLPRNAFENPQKNEGGL